MKPVNVYKAKLLNIAKLTLFSGTVCFIIYKLFIAYNMDEIAAGFYIEWNATHLSLLAFTLLLMLVNWSFEASKWKLIMGKHEEVTTLQAYQSVFTGVTLSIITPNQVGDIVGKAVYLKSFNKIKGAIVSLLGGLSQTIASVTFGLIALWCLAGEKYRIDQPLFIVGCAGIAALLAGIYYVYFHIHWLEKLGRWEKVKTYVTAFTVYSRPELTRLVLLSLGRFCVFSFQYFLLLRFFNIEITLINALLCISSIFLVQGFLPSFILIQIGVRGATALFFFGLFVSDTAGILLAAYSLWIINIMLPGMVGLYYLLKLKWSNPS